MNINSLDKIQKVAVPDAIFERLQQKIEAHQQDTLSTSKTILLSSLLILVLIVNSFLVYTNKSQNTEIVSNQNIINSMQLSTNPHLYYE